MQIDNLWYRFKVYSFNFCNGITVDRISKVETYLNNHVLNIYLDGSLRELKLDFRNKKYTLHAHKLP